MRNAELIAEARRAGAPWVADFHPDSLVGIMLRLADALEKTTREMHARELHHFEEEQARAKAEAKIARAVEWRDEAYHGEFGAGDYAQGYSYARRSIQRILTEGR